jgi:hypothetical protein
MHHTTRRFWEYLGALPEPVQKTARKNFELLKRIRAADLRANISSSVSPTAVLAVDVNFSGDSLVVRLSDAREVSVPLEWFPRLRDATPEQRQNWRFIAKGIGIHWEEVDEDIAVSTLLRM